MKKVLTFTLSHLHNGEHYEFEGAILGIFTPALAAALNLTDRRAKLQRAHDRETEVYRTNQGYRQTKKLTELDAARDSRFNYIKTTVNLYLRVGDDAQKAAAEAVAFVLKPYRRGPVRGYSDNTAELGKFVVDMSVAPYPAHIATLGLTVTLAALKADNDAFRTLYDARSEEGLDRAEHEKIRALRREFDDNYRVVTAVLPAACLIETDAAKKAAIDAAIEALNAHILQVKKELAARGDGSSLSVDPDPDHPDGPTTQPEYPDDEDDDDLPDDPYIDPNA